MTGGFDWLEKDRDLHKRDLARAYGFVKRETAHPAGTAGGQPMVLGNWIAGQPCSPADGRTLDDVDPATNARIATIPRSGAADVAAAVEAAKAAQRAWAATPLPTRCGILARAADLLEGRLMETARLESHDTGKPISLSSTLDVPRAVRNLRFFADFARGEAQEEYPKEGHRNYTVRAPVGVVGLITPWNLPIYLLSWKLAPALAMGNAVVAKPSELTPLSADALARILHEAGLPPGVFNVVHGLGAEAGQALVEHPDVRAISFTGGTATGRRVAAASAPLLKRVSLELGGKNPTIVFADCDMEPTVAGVARASFTNTGQICLCGSRLLVETPIAQEFTQRLARAAQALTLGDPLAPGTRLGSLISLEHRKKVESYVALAREEGGRIVTGGHRPKLGTPWDDGAWLEPTIITGLPQDSRCVREEIFGPVVTVQPFADEREAVALANGTSYGLAASVWSGDTRKAARVAEALETGMVWVNSWLVRDLEVPFGGMKDSGIGREGGRHSLDFFSELRNICVPD